MLEGCFLGQIVDIWPREVSPAVNTVFYLPLPTLQLSDSHVWQIADTTSGTSGVLILDVCPNKTFGLEISFSVILGVEFSAYNRIEHKIGNGKLRMELAPFPRFPSVYTRFIYLY